MKKTKKRKTKKQSLSTKTKKAFQSKLKPKKPLKSKKEVKKSKPASALTLKPTTKKISTLDYYHCLCQRAQTGFRGKKITQACQECKHSAPLLGIQRKKEVQKLVGAYKQLGISLSKLLDY